MTSIPKCGLSRSVYVYLKARIPDGATSQEIRRYYQCPYKKVKNALGYLLRLKLVKKTVFEGTLTRYYVK